MTGQYDFDSHFGGALDKCIEIVHLEPEQYTIAIGFIDRVADGAVAVLGFKTVQLQDEMTILHQLLVVLAAVSPAAPQQVLIPLAAGFDIGDTDERLGAHGFKTSKKSLLHNPVAGSC